MNHQNNIQRRGLPAELMNELFASLPVENAFNLLVKMPNGLLARNVQKMIIGIKEQMKLNKWNEKDCGQKLAISADGIEVKNSWIEGNDCGVRAVLPISTLNMKVTNKGIIAFYYEVQILHQSTSNFGIVIGFCCKQIPLLHGWLVKENNLIGIWQKEGISIDGFWKNLRNSYGYFEKGDFVGIGIIHQPDSKMECFATLNGELLGKAEMPPKFAHLQLFPTINLYNSGDFIRANFGKDEWKFKQFEDAIKQRIWKWL